LSSKVSAVWVVAGVVRLARGRNDPIVVGRLRNASGSEHFQRLGGFCTDSRGFREHSEQAVGSNIRDVTDTIVPMRCDGAMTCTGWRYGERPVSCPGSRPGFSIRDVEGDSAQPALKRRHCG
jgi:hypothetical protein